MLLSVMTTRCTWCGDDPLYVAYHDNEWGVPQHDDTKLFEAIILDGFQAGLSWITILRKRENFRKAFHHFNPITMAAYAATDVERLMNDTGIIRNRLKINAAITNAQAFLKIQKEFGSFDQYIWQFTHHKTITNRWETNQEIPATSAESDAMSKDLKSRGFKFCGSTICYAFMQACGMINDHLTSCFKYQLT